MMMSATPLSSAACRCPAPAVTPTAPLVSVGAGVAPVIVHGTPGLSTSGTWLLSSVPLAPVNVSEITRSAGTTGAVPVGNDHTGRIVGRVPIETMTCGRLLERLGGGHDERVVPPALHRAAVGPHFDPMHTARGHRGDRLTGEQRIGPILFAVQLQRIPVRQQHQM